MLPGWAMTAAWLYLPYVHTLVLLGFGLSELGCARKDRSSNGENDKSRAGSPVEVLLFHTVSLPIASNILNKFHQNSQNIQDKCSYRNSGKR